MRSMISAELAKYIPSVPRMEFGSVLAKQYRSAADYPASQVERAYTSQAKPMLKAFESSMQSRLAEYRDPDSEVRTKLYDRLNREPSPLYLAMDATAAALAATLWRSAQNALLKPQPDELAYLVFYDLTRGGAFVLSMLGTAELSIAGETEPLLTQISSQIPDIVEAANHYIGSNKVLNEHGILLTANGSNGTNFIEKIIARMRNQEYRSRMLNSYPHHEGMLIAGATWAKAVYTKAHTALTQ